MHRIKAAALPQLALVAATTKRCRAVRYRGGETAQKKTLDDFCDIWGRRAPLSGKNSKTLAAVDGCGLLFSFEDAVGRRGGTFR